MKRLCNLCLIVISLLAVSGSVQAQEAARQVAKRLLGGRASEFEFYTVEQWAKLQKTAALPAVDTSSDVFLLAQRGKKIAVVGNNDNSMCMGLNHYLKDYALTSVSWYADQPVELPKSLPKVVNDQPHQVQVPYRFFLNYCTYGYTMPWWGWEQWERFIDWMALNGINMPLALTGQEAVWQEVWREMGVSDDDLRYYFSGPAHLPWHRMANLDGFGGPLPQGWIDGQKALQQRILARERELNMTPVLPAFAGHVPKALVLNHPNADIKELSAWCGFPSTCFLNSTDPLFAEIQRRYLEKQTELYGTSHVYGVDPFNEMDPPSWDTAYLANVSHNIFGSLIQVDSAARWLQMSWVFYYKRAQWTPERLKAYLTGVPQGRMILLDYFCEKTEVWRETQGFYGQPFIWCYLGNFGGNTMLVGDIPALGEKLDLALAEQGGNLMGIGSTLESFDNSPQIFDFLFEHAWVDPMQKDIHIRQFPQRWADYRYGARNDNARRAWQLLTDSVYHDWSFYGLGTQMAARPSFEGHGTYYTKPYYSYDNATLLRAVRLLMDKPSPRASYQYDVANLLSQWMGNHFMEVRDAFTLAYRAKDVEQMRQHKATALGLMRDADELLCDVGDFNFWEWTSAARKLGGDRRESNYYERQARTLLTIWGGPVLNDYANRLWGGLLRGYYSHRWERFFSSAIQAVEAGRLLDEKAFAESLSQYEKDWVTYTKDDAPKHSQKQVVEHAQQILRKRDLGVYDVADFRSQRIGEMLNRFPESQLQDIYKSCFQDVYGPGHIISDTAKCLQYILSELESTDVDSSLPAYELCGVEGNFVRVNLSVVKGGKITAEQLVDALIRSAANVKPMPIYDWRGTWDRLMVAIRKQAPPSWAIDQDAGRIRQLLDGGKYVMHHSSQFNQAYNYHYRIIRRDIFEQEILPRL